MPDYTQDQYEDQQRNPAAPTGLRQESGRYASNIDALSAFTPDSYADDARTWYGGRNVEGVEGGWDNDFMDEVFASYDAFNQKLADEQELPANERTLTAYDWLNGTKNPGNVGIAFWDDPDEKFKVGDVVRNGRAVRGQNLYDNFDEETASLILGDFLFSSDEKAHFNRHSDPGAKWAEEVTAATEAQSEAAVNAPTALEYQADVEEEQAEILDSWVPEAVAGTSAVATAGAAAAAGAAVGGPAGALIAGGTAFVLAGLGAWLNQDQLTEQIARGRVQADRARDRYGTATWMASGLNDVGEVGIKLISPFTNLTQGIYDSLDEGGIGDGTAAFYEVDAEGDRIASGWWQAADLAAAVGDGVLQFSHPTGITMYTATMGATVFGQVGVMTSTGMADGGQDKAAGFNERTGQWDEYEGAGEFLSAVGAVGIDAIQMGVGAALGKAAAASKKAFNLERAGAAGSRDDVIINGFRFKFDADGVVVKKRATATIIAPSEAVKWVAVSWRARNIAARSTKDLGAVQGLKGGLPASAAGRYQSEASRSFVGKMVGTKAPGPDDYYSAALEMSRGTTFSDALLNGFAEGWEEGIQGFLEPKSFGESASGEEIRTGILYGFASGLGMGIGPGTQKVSAAQVQEYRAKTLYMQRKSLASITQEEWNAAYRGPGMTEGDRERMAIASPEEAVKIQAHLDTFKELHQHVQMGSALPITALNNIRKKSFEQLHKNRNKNIEGSRVLMGRGADYTVYADGSIDDQVFKADAAVQSLEQTVKDLRDIWLGLETQEQALAKEVERWTNAVANAEKGSDAQAVAQQKLDQYTAELDTFDLRRQVSNEISGKFLDLWNQFMGTADVQDRKDLVVQMNKLLDAAYDGEWRDGKGKKYSDDIQKMVKRAVELRIARHPMIDSGSSGVFRPAISYRLTELGQDATAYLHQGRLASLGADHDGDQGVSMNASYLPEQQLDMMRSGAYYLQTVTTEEQLYKRDKDGNPLPEFDQNGDPIPAEPLGDRPRKINTVKVVTDPADGHKARADYGMDALTDARNPARQQIVRDGLAELEYNFHSHYVRANKVFTQDEMQTILDEYRKAILHGEADAEQVLMDAMFNMHKEELLQLGLSENMPEMLWMKEQFEKFWVQTQVKLSANAAGEAKPVSSVAAQVTPAESSRQTDKARRDAARTGLTLQTILDYTSDPTRQAQNLHYNPFYKSAVDSGQLDDNGRMDSARVQDFVEMFSNLFSGMTVSALEGVSDKDQIEARVQMWLGEILERARRDDPDNVDLRGDEALILIANTRVADLDMTDPNVYVATQDQTTLLQILLKQSVNMEARLKKDAPKDDAIHKKIKRLKKLTKPQAKHSTTANRALMAVYGDIPMFQLAGDAADGIGGNLTPNQLMKSLMPLNEEGRRDQAAKWRRLPAFLQPFEKKHDPPYSIEELTSGSVNAFTLLVQAIVAEANTELGDMANRSDTVSDQFRGFHKDLTKQRKRWGKVNHVRLLAAAKARGEKEVSDAAVLEDMLQHQPEIASWIVNVLPEAATLGIFSLQNGEVLTAQWLQDALLQDDILKAEQMIWVNAKFAELNVLGGTQVLDKQREKERAEARKKGVKEKDLPPRKIVSGVDPSKIKSRFLQVVYRLMTEDPTGYELDNLLRVADSSPSLEHFLKTVNGESNWVGDNGKLIAYYDDTADYEADPSTMWTDGGGMQLLRERIAESNQRMAKLDSAVAKADVNRKAEERLIRGMRKFLEGKSGYEWAEHWVGRMDMALQNAKAYPDTLGPAARDQFMEMVQFGVMDLADKGAPATGAVGVGVPRITTNGSGAYRGGFSQEMDAQTALSWEEVKANLSGLAAGPVRIMLEDGKILTIDFSSVDTALEALADPRTRAFAQAVIFPTVRDVDTNGTSQHYRRISTAETDQVDTPLKRMLVDATYSHLWPKTKYGLATAAQADEFLGLVESGVRRAAEESSQEERDAAENPIQNALNDFLVAYTHGKYEEDQIDEQVRQQLVQEFATVLMNLTLVKDPATREHIKKMLAAKLQAKYGGNIVPWELANMDPNEIKVFDALVSDAVQTGAEFEMDRLDALLADPNIDPATQAKLEAEYYDVIARKDAYAASDDLQTRLSLLPPSVDAAIQMWAGHVNDTSNAQRMKDVRLSLLRYLMSGNKIDKFVSTKGTGLLARKARAILKGDPTQIIKNDKITEKQWNELAMFAATSVVSESSLNVSAGLGLLPMEMDAETDILRSYYDRSWSYLLDPLFDERVSSVATNLASRGNYTIGMDYSEVADQIERLLFNDDKLGDWTQLVVQSSMNARKALLGAPVLGGIQVHGQDPMELRDFVGTAWATVDTNLAPEHHADAVVNVVHTLAEPGTLNRFMHPHEYMNVEHHFVNKVQVTAPDGTVFDLLQSSTEEYVQDQDVAKAGYHIFRSDLFEKQFADARKLHGEGTYRVEITYVDVDTKPHTPEHVNNILFDGVARSASAAVTPGPVADLFFGVGAISKQGQQNPLDFAAKMGTAFRQFVTTKFHKVAEGEGKSSSLAEMLQVKVTAMWGHEYETGHLALGDQNGLYKLMKMRTVVRGKDKDGVWQYRWAEEVITAEKTNNTGALPFDQYQIIPLSLPVAQTLHGRSAEQGTQALTRPELNLMNLDTFPSLDNARLRELGLENLGDQATLEHSGFGNILPMSPLPRSTKGRGQERVAATEQRMLFWQGQAHQFFANRSRHAKQMNFKDSQLNARGILQKLTNSEQLATTLSMFGIPFVQNTDMSSVHQSALMEKNLERILGDNTFSMIWHHDHLQETGSDPAQAVIGRASIRNGFRDVKVGNDEVGPTYKDLAIINLDSIKLSMGNDHGKAYDEAQAVIRAYAKRGTTVVLAGEASAHLRADLAEWMRTGELRYQSIGGSPHWFEPISPENARSRNVDALQSTLEEVRHVSPAGVNYRFVSDMFGIYVSENAALYDPNNADQIEWDRVVSVLIPTALNIKVGENRTAWNLPVQGAGVQDQWGRVSRYLSDQLDNDEVVAHLKKKSGGVNGNPEDVTTRVVGEDGYIRDGVLSFDDAMTRFKEHLQAGTTPLDQGQELIAGDFYVVIDQQERPLLMRYGFEIPGGLQLESQLNTEVGDDKPKAGGNPLGIGIAKAKLEEAQTVPPPTTIDKINYQDKRLRIEGTYKMSPMMKDIAQGVKAGLTPMPPTLAFPELGMSDNFAITTGMAEQSVFGKQGSDGTVRNFQEAFVLSGIDFRNDLVDFFFGKKQRTEAEYGAEWVHVQAFLNAWASKAWPQDVIDNLTLLLSAGTWANTLGAEMNAIADTLLPGWNKRDFTTEYENDPMDPTSRIASVILTTLMIPGITTDHVQGTTGLLHMDKTAVGTGAVKIPAFMSEALNDLQYPATRDLLIKRVNANARWPEIDLGNGSVGEYYLSPDFSFYVMMRNPQTGQRMRFEGQLQRIESLPYDKDAASIAAAQLSQKTSVSPHVSTVTAETIGAYTALSKLKQDGAPDAVDAIFGENDIEYFNDSTSFHEIFAKVREDLEHYSPWEGRLPGGQRYIGQGTARYAQYNKAITKADKDGKAWGPEAENLVLEFLDVLNLKPSQAYEVDILVRQFLGRPGAKEGTDEADVISEKSYRQAVQMLLDNVNDNMNPLHGGAVHLPSESFWSKVFKAQAGARDPWAPVAQKKRRKKVLAQGYEQWVFSLFDQVRSSKSPFHAMYRLDVDAFWHTYQGARPTFASLPLSMDDQVDLMLMDAETNLPLVSMDPLTQALYRDPVLMEDMSFNLDTLTGHNTDLVRPDVAAQVSSSALQEQIERQKAWLKGNKLGRQKPTSTANYYRNGVSYVEQTTSTSNFFTNLNHIQIINRLANPSLWVSALFEVPSRNLFEHVTNMTTGRNLSVSGVASRKLTDFAPGDLKRKYSTEEVAALRKLATSMGSKTEWRAMLFGEMLYQDTIRKSGPNKASAALEKTATMMARATGDPRLGMLAKSAALRYLDAALEYLDQVDNSINVEQFVKLMMDDPLWLEKNSPEGQVTAHTMGVNRVARVRGVRQTGINKVALGWIDRMERSNSIWGQGLGFFLNVPFRFKRFNVGTFLHITGLDALDQTFSMMRDKRPKDGVVGRVQAAMRGEDYTPSGYTDYSDVLDSIDLSTSFVRSGMTQTGLIMAATFAGELNLDGEDEESRRRRRMMQYLNGLYLYDPRKMENDFLYADALFLDSVPILGELFFEPTGPVGADGQQDGRSVVVPHWIIRQFTSPVMGVQRFFTTGNPQEIKWGFQDAISAIPYSALNLWDQSVVAFDLLNQEADRMAKENGDVLETQNAISSLLWSGVTILEKALLENSFINSIRNASDEFDRNPYGEIERNKVGEVVRGIDDQPVPETSLESYRDENGEVREAYATRPEGGVGGQKSHAYAENNLTWSILASLFTGQAFQPGQSSFKRSNMLVKEQSVNVPESTKAEAEALILSAWYGKSNRDEPSQAIYTEDEIIRKMKKDINDAGLRWDQTTVEEDARAQFESQMGQPSALSLLDEDGNEVIAKAGARGIYESLYKGMIGWEETEKGVLDGVIIPYDMRVEIGNEWIEELVQYGVDKGMGLQAAQYYARRIWDGDKFNPEAGGLKDLLWDERIPYDGKVKYNQLNTTYMLGPDGRPWATPFQRQSVAQAMGIITPHRTHTSGVGMGKDKRGKSVDEVLGINTGLHGLVRKPFEKREPPEDQFEIAAEKTSTTTPGTGYKKYPRYWTRRWPSYGRSSGGYSSSSSGYFIKMNPLPDGTAARVNGVPMINSNNPYIRRARVNRQRISSQRGRLKQWQ